MKAGESMLHVLLRLKVTADGPVPADRIVNVLRTSLGNSADDKYVATKDGALLHVQLEEQSWMVGVPTESVGDDRT